MAVGHPERSFAEAKRSRRIPLFYPKQSIRWGHDRYCGGTAIVLEHGFDISTGPSTPLRMTPSAQTLRMKDRTSAARDVEFEVLPPEKKRKREGPSLFSSGSRSLWTICCDCRERISASVLIHFSD